MQNTLQEALICLKSGKRPLLFSQQFNFGRIFRHDDFLHIQDWRETEASESYIIKEKLATLWEFQVYIATLIS